MRCDGFSGSSPAPVTGAAATCNSMLCLPGRAGRPELISPSRTREPCNPSKMNLQSNGAAPGPAKLKCIQQ